MFTIMYFYLWAQPLYIYYIQITRYNGPLIYRHWYSRLAMGFKIHTGIDGGGGGGGVDVYVPPT